MIAAFRRSPYNREIIRIGLPALGALAADPLVSLVDTAFIGRLGATALASVAIASAIFVAVFAVFTFLEYAVTPLVAQSIGAGSRNEAGRFTVAALAMSVSSSGGRSDAPSGPSSERGRRWCSATHRCWRLACSSAYSSRSHWE